MDKFINDILDAVEIDVVIIGENICMETHTNIIHIEIDDNDSIDIWGDNDFHITINDKLDFIDYGDAYGFVNGNNKICIAIIK